MYVVRFLLSVFDISQYLLTITFQTYVVQVLQHSRHVLYQCLHHVPGIFEYYTMAVMSQHLHNLPGVYGVMIQLSCITTYLYYARYTWCYTCSRHASILAARTGCIWYGTMVGMHQYFNPVPGIFGVLLSVFMYHCLHHVPGVFGLTPWLPSTKMLTHDVLFMCILICTVRIPSLSCISYCLHHTPGVFDVIT